MASLGLFEFIKKRNNSFIECSLTNEIKQNTMIDDLNIKYQLKSPYFTHNEMRVIHELVIFLNHQIQLVCLDSDNKKIAQHFTCPLVF